MNCEINSCTATISSAQLWPWTHRASGCATGCAPRLLRQHRAAPRTAFSFAEVAARYGFPKPSGPRQVVAILSLGGYYSPLDLQGFCKHYGYRVPQIASVKLPGATPTYSGNIDSADGENALDLQAITGASAGEHDILFFCAPNTEQGYADGLNRIAGYAATNPSLAAASTSWGLAESLWSAAGRQKISDAAQLLRQRGVPLFAASGDGGSRDGTRAPSADFPASCPWVIACGGTSLAGGAERAWAGSGGGASRLFGAPHWQAKFSAVLTGAVPRLVPDVSGSADPNAGYPVYLNGEWHTLGGTSAVAPLLAAGVASCVAARGGRRFTDLAERLYAAARLFGDVTQGSNGDFKAGKGYDEVTGLGVFRKEVWDALLADPAPVKPHTEAPALPARIQLRDDAGNILGTYALTAA